MTHYLLIRASAGAAGVCSLYCTAQTVMVSALCFLSQKWAGFSSCKISIFDYRATRSADQESILVLQGLKCAFPQIFQELATAKSGSGFAFSLKALSTHLVCTAVFLWCIQFVVTTYHLSFPILCHLKLDVKFLRHVYGINFLGAYL